MTDDSLLGSQFDEYRLESLLGKGGMARVYRALDVRLDRYVAIKVIDTPYRSDTDYTLRFEREAQAIARLEHPHIVRLYRFGEVDGLLYMAMQYVQGVSLRYILDSYNADHEFMDPGEASRIIRQICLALDYAHQQGVIHRDVKPSNIMLDDQGNALLTDFGLALLTEVGTRGEIFGSPQYIAPEQAISSANAVPQSDLYSVGIILYELFTGQVPFDASDPLDTARMHMMEEPAAPRELRPEISPALDAVILKTLAKEPERRFSNGLALADALDLALHTAEGSTLAAATTLMRPAISIPEYVAGEMDENPLPPIPAAVAMQANSSTIEEQSAPPPPGLDNQYPAEHPDHRKRTNRLTSVWTAPVVGGALTLVILLMAVGWWLWKRPLQLVQSDKASEVHNEVQDIESTEPVVASQGNSTETPAPTLEEESSRTSEMGETPTIESVLPTTTPEITVTASATPTVTSTPTPQVITLLLVRKRDDSLFIVNTGSSALLLDPLSLRNKVGQVTGDEWDVEYLDPGQCVIMWKDSDNSKVPDVTCERVGVALIREGRQRLWKEDLELYYGEDFVGVCTHKDTDKNGCSITIEIAP